MTVEIKRCCNSSVKVSDNKITFTAFNISLEGPYKTDFDKIVDYYINVACYDPQMPDLKAKILERILYHGLDYVTDIIEEEGPYDC